MSQDQPQTAEFDVTQRLDQIERTSLRVLPTDVGKWAMTTGNRSAAEAVVIAPADLYWLLAMVRATRVTPPGTGDTDV